MVEAGPTAEAIPEEDNHLQIVPVSASPSQEKNENHMDHRFQRTDRWLPVYSWLESLDREEVVNSNDVLEWLTANPDIREQLYSRHSRYHLMHYIKKCHMKVLKRKGKIMGMASFEMDHNNGETKGAPGSNLSSMPKDGDLYKAKHKEALEKYGILVEFEKHLLNMIRNVKMKLDGGV